MSPAAPPYIIHSERASFIHDFFLVWTPESTEDAADLTGSQPPKRVVWTFETLLVCHQYALPPVALR
jgi:hypothetical protein